MYIDFSLILKLMLLRITCFCLLVGKKVGVKQKPIKLFSGNVHTLN